MRAREYSQIDREILQFSRLKIFAVFAGCILTTKILSHEKFSTGIRTHVL